MPRIWLSLGSNQARESSLRGAVRMLREAFGPLVLSAVYETDAVGAKGAGWLPVLYNPSRRPLPGPVLHVARLTDAIPLLAG